jgi:hypothetical protein
MTTKRIPDTNGWIEVKDNPLSKVGVFDYSGAAIGGHGGLDPYALYGVYRPAEELSSKDTVASARLVPWVDDHPRRLLGSEESGLVPAEEKGIEGVTGEDIYFKDDTLFGNIKVFSQSLADEIANGKTELSMGYACKYERSDGEFEGRPYQFIQRGIRFNHVALVKSGRMGPDVAVLDSHDEGVEMENEKKEATDVNPAELLDTAIAALTALKAAIGGAAKPEAAPAAPAAPAKDEDTNGEDAEGAEGKDEKLIKAAQTVIEIAKQEEGPGVAPTDPTVPPAPAPVTGKDAEGDPPASEAKAEDEDEAKPEAKAEGMDAKEFLKHVATRDKLANALKPYIGTFDHAEMTLSEVAGYGAKKLGLNVKGTGHEMAALQGYLAGRKPPQPVPQTHAMDEKHSSIIDSYIQGEK